MLARLVVSCNIELDLASLHYARVIGWPIIIEKHHVMLLLECQQSTCTYFADLGQPIAPFREAVTRYFKCPAGLLQLLAAPVQAGQLLH